MVKGEIKEYLLRPESFGLKACKSEDLVGGSPEENAEILKHILSGKKGPQRDIVLVNSSVAIIAGGRADNLEEAIIIARQAIDDGSAEKKLNDLCKASRA